MKKLFLLIFIIVFSSLFSFANETNIIDLSKQKWEYRWGDSPFENGIPLWTKDKENSSKWQTIQYPSNPPKRDGNTNVWYRVKLPDNLTNDPHVYIFSMDLVPQVYYKSKMIYSFGKLDEKGQGKYSGWPWHMFSIPLDSAGEYLYFRIYSHYLDIGMYGEILIASKGKHFERMLDYDIPKIMVGSVATFVAFLFLLSYLAKLKRTELLILGLLFLSQGLNILFSVKITQMYLFYPLLKQYILAICFFFFPIGMAMFMDKSIKLKTPFNLVKRVWQVHLVYLLGAVSGALIGFYDISSTYEYFDKLYYFVTLPILTIYMIYFFIKGDSQVRLITSSFLIISIYWVYSFLLAYHILPWAEYPSDIAVFLSLLLLSYSVIKKLNYTSELEEEKEELTVLSTIDHLTKLYNRKEIDKLLVTNENLFKRYKEEFSVILLDLDNFKHVNDTYGHLAGDKFLVDLGDILTKFTREVDQVGRWGGEEFLIVCPKTNKEKALKVAEGLRVKIENYDFEVVGKKTASFGVATVKEDETIKDLIARADEAMYTSKKEGKNKVSYK